MSHVHAAPVGGSPPPTEDIPHPGSVESLVAALDPSGVRLFLWDVFLFFFAVVAILRLDYFFKRVIDRGFPPPTPPTPPPELPVRRRPPMTAEDHARILAKYRANHPPATPQQGDE
ncbi:hypothetical protein N7524_001178 [Penicillium chrysogenum]|nr:hypothetical protein N7524_001178 [Penicillium chrysogenum]